MNDQEIAAVKLLMQRRFDHAFRKMEQKLLRYVTPEDVLKLQIVLNYNEESNV